MAPATANRSTLVVDVNRDVADGRNLGYRMVMPFDKPGQWLIVVTQADQWGCFLIEVEYGQPSPRSIGEIELAGQSIPIPVPPDFPPPSFHTKESEFGRVGGESSRRCVDANDLWQARSGEVVIRSLAAYRSEWTPAKPTGKVLIVPLHQPVGIAPTNGGAFVMQVAATSLDDPSYRYLYETDLINRGVGSLELAFPGILSLPRNGHWALVVTLREDWGCFVVALN